MVPLVRAAVLAESSVEIPFSPLTLVVCPNRLLINFRNEISFLSFGEGMNIATSWELIPVGNSTFSTRGLRMTASGLCMKTNVFPRCQNLTSLTPIWNTSFRAKRSQNNNVSPVTAKASMHHKAHVCQVYNCP